MFFFFFVVFQAEDGIRDLVRSRGLGDVYKRQEWDEGAQAVLARRRPRGNDERHPWMGASAVGPGLSLIHI